MWYYPVNKAHPCLFFSVKSQIYAPEDFHCKTFYFMFSICNSILKWECWNRTKHKGISHKDAVLLPLITPSFLQPQIPTALFATTVSLRSKLRYFFFLHHKPSSEMLLPALPLVLPEIPPQQHGSLDVYHPSLDQTEQIHSAFLITSQAGVEWTESEGLSHRSGSRSARDSNVMFHVSVQMCSGIMDLHR